MTFDNHDPERNRTLHGEPLPLPDYSVGPAYPSGPPPRKPNGGLVVAISAISVIVVGLAAVLLWILNDKSTSDSTSSAADQSSVASVTNAVPAPGTVTTTVPAPTSTTQTPTTETSTDSPQPTVPATGTAWYAQFGAFNNYDNAQATAAEHYGAVVLPGSTLGLDTAYVVVRPAASQDEAASVCAKFAEGSCYVRSGQ